MDIVEVTDSFQEESFDKSAKLSRNFETRTAIETQELYETIKSAVICAQDPQNEDSDKALAFIVYVFNPLIKKIASKIYLYIKDYEEYEDTLQETYAIFIKLVYGYNPMIATFPYYIRDMLPRQVKAWSQRTKKKSQFPLDTLVVNQFLADPLMSTQDNVYSRHNSYVLHQEYEEFIKKRAEKKTIKTSTVKEVCYNYFLGHSTCTEISKKLGISYHAVYEVIHRIRDELKIFLEDNCYTEFDFDKDLPKKL